MANLARLPSRPSRFLHRLARIVPLSELVKFTTQGGGEDLAHRFVGTTPDLENEGHYGRRDMEIQSWRNDHGHTGPWLAIDDTQDIFRDEEGELANCPHLYLVEFRTGLTDADTTAIIEKIDSPA